MVRILTGLSCLSVPLTECGLSKCLLIFDAQVLACFGGRMFGGDRCALLKMGSERMERPD